MAAAVASIGLMDSAYFVGRGEILSWINATLQLSLAKVEEVSLCPQSPIPPPPRARVPPRFPVLLDWFVPEFVRRDS
jgi:hypothetical protein